MKHLAIEDPRVIVALDFSNGEQARQFVERLEPGSCRLKIGKELFTSEGPELVRYFTAKGHKLFLDLKFHDIPNTVANTIRKLEQAGADLITVHASGGESMLQRAAASAVSTKILAVTVLTSIDESESQKVYSKHPEEMAG